MSSLSTSLKNSYQKWLCPYEDYLRLAKPGVHQQLEWENGGPLTPSPAPSPMKPSNVHTPSSLRGDSPARHATSALQASVNSERDTPILDAQAPPPQPVTSGFTAINSGGFTAVNSGFTSVNRPVAPDPKTSTPTKQFGSPAPSTKNTPEYRPSSLGPGTASALKRQLSHDSLDSARENGADQDDDGGSRRSKRLKKGMYLASLRFFTPKFQSLFLASCQLMVAMICGHVRAARVAFSIDSFHRLFLLSANSAPKTPTWRPVKRKHHTPKKKWRRGRFPY